jgi:hypothetical protein
VFKFPVVARPVTFAVPENTALPVTLNVFDKVAAPRAKRVPSISTAVDVIKVLTVELPTLILVVVRFTLAPTLAPLEKLPVAVDRTLEFDTVLIVALPILIPVTERFTLAPIFTPVVALAVVVFSAPLKVPRPVTVSVFARAAAPVTLAVPDRTVLPVTYRVFERTVFPVTLNVFDKVAAPRAASVPSVSIAVDVMNVFTVELPTLNLVVVKLTLAPTLAPVEKFPVPVENKLELDEVFTVELPIFRLVVVKLTLAPIFTPVVALAVVVLRAPFSDANPVTLAVPDRTVLPVTERVFDRATAPVTLAVPEKTLLPVTERVFASAAAPVILAVPEATRLEEIVSKPLVETFPPLRLVFATIVVAEKMPIS